MRQRARIAGVLAIGQALGRGTVAVYTIAVVGLLAKDDYGDLAFALAVAGIGVAVADAGLSRLLVRNVARSSEPGRTVRELLKARAVCVIVVATATGACCAAGWLPLETGLAVGMVAYLTTEALAYGFESSAVGAERPWRFAVVQALAAVALLAALGWLVLSGATSPVAAIAGLCVASAVKLSAHVVIWRRASPTSGRPFHQLPLRKWMNDGAPFLALTVLAAVYYRLGIVVMHAIRGAEETAPFAASFRVFDAFAIVGGIVFAAVSPPLSRLHRDGPDQIWPLWKRLQGIAIMGAVPTVIVLGVAAESVAGVLFGERYAESAGASLRLLAPGMALLVMQAISAAVVMMADTHHLVVRLTAVNVAIALVLTIALVSIAGSNGAAAAMSIAEAVSFIGFALLVRHSFGPSRAVSPPGAPMRRASGSSAR